MKNFLTTLAIALLFSCQNNAQNNDKQQAVINADPIEIPIENGKAKAYFASGCFWCVEAIFERLEGVVDVRSGYTGGKIENPTYDDVCSGETGHVEVVQVDYNPLNVQK